MSAMMESLQLSICELQKKNRHLHEVKVSQGYHNSYTMPKLDYVTLNSTSVRNLTVPHTVLLCRLLRRNKQKNEYNLGYLHYKTLCAL